MVKNWINAGRSVPLQDLIAAGGAKFRGSDNAKYYYQSYLLTRFLMRKYPTKFTTYYAREAQPGAIPPAQFYEIFETSPAELENKWREYVRGL
jgi:hypothetical protein